MSKIKHSIIIDAAKVLSNNQMLFQLMAASLKIAEDSTDLVKRTPSTEETRKEFIELTMILIEAIICINYFTNEIIKEFKQSPELTEYMNKRIQQLLRELNDNPTTN
jgi:hypothetical protein